MGMSSDGLVQLLDNMTNVQKEFSKWIKDFVFEMGLRSLAKTKKRTPVITGFLRNSWQVSDVFRKGDVVYVMLTNTAEYASFVEEGHQAYKKGFDAVGNRQKGKYVEGYHMAKISIAEIRAELPIRFLRSFKQWTMRIAK